VSVATESRLSAEYSRGVTVLVVPIHDLRPGRAAGRQQGTAAGIAPPHVARAPPLVGQAAPRVPTHLVWAEVAGGGTPHLIGKPREQAAPAFSAHPKWAPAARLPYPGFSALALGAGVGLS